MAEETDHEMPDLVDSSSDEGENGHMPWGLLWAATKQANAVAHRDRDLRATAGPSHQPVGPVIRPAIAAKSPSQHMELAMGPAMSSSPSSQQPPGGLAHVELESVRLFANMHKIPEQVVVAELTPLTRGQRVMVMRRFRLKEGYSPIPVLRSFVQSLSKKQPAVGEAELQEPAADLQPAVDEDLNLGRTSATKCDSSIAEGHPAVENRLALLAWRDLPPPPLRTRLCGHCGMSTNFTCDLCWTPMCAWDLPDHTCGSTGGQFRSGQTR
jgi:hypothetical protein